jgi:nucleoside-diphosphate-sugar epimerase
MKIFVTGASGFVGSAVVQELLKAGHPVTGLARSDANANAIAALGAQVLRGSLEDPASLARGASESEGVVHCAFIHDFSNYAASVQADIRAIDAMGNALAGSGRPLVVTSGSVRVPGGMATEDTPADPNFPRRSEATALPFAQREVRVSIVRLPPTVHGAGDHGFMAELIRIAREKGVAGYVGDGANRWPAVHRLDAARAFRLAVEKAPAGTRLHAMAEEGIPTREIAAVIGRRLKVSVESKPVEHFGWLGPFFSFDVPASSERTRKSLGWQPVEKGLLADLDSDAYFGAAGI